jgi:hypothetical protein
MGGSHLNAPVVAMAGAVIEQESNTWPKFRTLGQTVR